MIRPPVTIASFTAHPSERALCRYERLDGIADANDVNHPAAVAFQSQMSGPRRLIVTNYILDELYTLILMDLGYRQAVAIKQKLDILGAGHLLETIWIDASLGTEAWTVFERYNSDKQWSFTDCVSNVVMKARGMHEVFAFDHHFEQMGFVRLP